MVPQGVNPVHLPQLLIRNIPPTPFSSSTLSVLQTHPLHKESVPMTITITIPNFPQYTDAEEPIREPLRLQTHTTNRRGRQVLAPPSLNAVQIHQQNPVTSNTRLKGTGIYHNGDE